MGLKAKQKNEEKSRVEKKRCQHKGNEKANIHICNPAIPANRTEERKKTVTAV